MDPVANLARQRELAAEINRINDTADWDSAVDSLQADREIAQLALELAEHVQALDEWRRRGGFDPYTS